MPNYLAQAEQASPPANALQRARGPRLRPLVPGEEVLNPDGSYSSEITVTVQSPTGEWVNIPTLWMGEQGPINFGRDDRSAMQAATEYERSSGVAFPRFKSVREAEAEAQARSNQGGIGAGPLARER